jgi:hypothetical protein
VYTDLAKFTVAGGWRGILTEAGPSLLRLSSAVDNTTDRCFFSGQIALEDVSQHPLLLAICGQSIGHFFKLRAILGRTVRPGSPGQALHADVAHDSADAPVVGFILMLDAFTPTNGATRFIPGSQGWPNPSDRLEDPHLHNRAEVLACGDAGSIIIFNASVWHGHTKVDPIVKTIFRLQ